MRRLLPAFLFLFVFVMMGFSQGNSPSKATVCVNGQTVQVPAKAAKKMYANGVATPGACGSGCYDASLVDLEIFCLAIYNPVCGCDGITYSNPCVATFLNGITSFTPGECGCLTDPQNVFCPLYVDPVCGCDGKTYSNSCFASAAGVTSWTSGACGGVVFPAKTSSKIYGQALEVYPNPAASDPTIRFMVSQNQNVVLEIYDMNGQIISSLDQGQVEWGVLHEAKLDINDMPNGIYLVKLNGEDKLPAQKFIVNK